jgi:hypothetical protein
MRRFVLILTLSLHACSHEPEPPAAKAWELAEPKEIVAEFYPLEDGVMGTPSFPQGSPEYSGRRIVHEFILYPPGATDASQMPADMPTDPSHWYVLLPREFSGTQTDLAFQIPPNQTSVTYPGNWQGAWGYVTIYSRIPGLD